MAHTTSPFMNRDDLTTPLGRRRLGRRSTWPVASAIEALEPRQLMTAITGVTYADTNGNGARNTGEPGVPGIEVTYDGSNNTATSSDGSFTVSGAATSGTHYVGIATPAGWTLTEPTAASGRYVNTGADASLAFGIQFTPNFAANSPSASEVDLSWSSGDSALRAVIQRSSDEGSTWTTLTSTPLSSGTTTYADTDPALSPGTQYEYQLTMVDSTGNPIASSTVDATTLSGTLIAVHDTPLTFSGTTLWEIGVIPDGSDLTASVQTGATAQGGSVTANSDGSWTYTPPSDWIGSDTLTYTLSNGTTTSAPAALTVQVTDQAPVAGSLYAETVNFDPTVATNAAPAITATAGGYEGVFATDADGDSVTYHLVNADGTIATADGSGNVATPHGTVSLTSDGTYTYTPDAGFVGVDRFYYVANDGIENGNVASVTIVVNAGVPLIGVPDLLDTSDVGEPVTLSLDDSQNINTSQLQILSQPGHGSVSINSDGDLVYIASSTGLDSFTFGYGSDVPSSTALVDVGTGYDFTWGGLGNQLFAVNHGDTLSEPAALLDGVEYSPGGALSVELVSGPSSGTLTLGTNSDDVHDGSFTYTPAANTVGWVYFTYEVHAGDAVSPPITAAIDVNDPMPMESYAPLTLSTTRGTSLSFDPRTNFVDTEYPLDTLTTSIPTGLGPRNGTVTVNTDGTLTYTPNAGFTGVDSFTYQINDGVTEASFGSISQTDSLNSGYNTVYITVAST